MTDLIYTPITDPLYCGIITILNYEIRLSNCLKNLSFPPSRENKKQLVLIDLALKSGLDIYRFVDFSIDEWGHVLLNTNNYTTPNFSLEKKANLILREHIDIVNNSILPECKREKLLKIN